MTGIDTDKKRTLKAMLIFELFVLGLGGWLLHYRMHPPAKAGVNYLPFSAGIVSVFCLPLLFWFKKTLTAAYITNGFLVITGTVLMTYFSIARFEGPLTPGNLIVNSLFADIVLSWGKFGVGKALFVLQHTHSRAEATAPWRYFRYPRLGWWWVHLAGFAGVFITGKLLWK